MIFTAQQLEAQMPDATWLLSDEPEMESSLHYMQLLLLVTCLEWLWRDCEDFFIGANLTIYFSREQLKNRESRGPDLFLAKNTTKRARSSWVVWEEGGQYPDLIIELLSPSTAEIDRTVKKQLYQDRFRTPEYFWFSPDTYEFQGWRLNGNVYQAIAPSQRGWLWSEVLGLYLGMSDNQLRYFLPGGQIVPTPEEAAEQEWIRAEQERARAEQERTKAEQEHARAEQERTKAEQEHARAEQERTKAEQERTKAEQERIKAEQERTKAEQERTKAEQERTKAEQERARAEQERIRAEQERIRAEQAEQQLNLERQQRQTLLEQLRSLPPDQLQFLGIQLPEAAENES